MIFHAPPPPRTVAAVAARAQGTPAVASWYDDAGATACGFHAVLGVANRVLPCGTQVQLKYGGRVVVATVEDRGPFVAGRLFDLNATVKAALDCTDLCHLRYIVGVPVGWVRRWVRLPAAGGA